MGCVVKYKVQKKPHQHKTWIIFGSAALDWVYARDAPYTYKNLRPVQTIGTQNRV